MVGRMGMGWLADASEKIKDGLAAVTKLGTLVPNSSSHVAGICSIDIPCGMRNVSRQWYMCEGDIDDSTHGSLVAILLSEILGIKDVNLTFQLELKWTVEFSGPDVPTASEFAETQAVDGDFPYYTTSDGAFPIENKYLIVKAHVNGDPVKFTDLEPDFVYQLPEKATLNYYDSAKALKTDLKYGVKLRDFPYPTMVFFNDKTKAANYAQKGDLSNCLQYYGRGDWCSPANPVWTELPASFALVMTPDMSRSRTTTALRPRNLGIPQVVDSDDIVGEMAEIEREFEKLQCSPLSGE